MTSNELFELAPSMDYPISTPFTRDLIALRPIQDLVDVKAIIIEEKHVLHIEKNQ